MLTKAGKTEWRKICSKTYDVHHRKERTITTNGTLNISDIRWGRVKIGRVKKNHKWQHIQAHQLILSYNLQNIEHLQATGLHFVWTCVCVCACACGLTNREKPVSFCSEFLVQFQNIFRSSEPPKIKSEQNLTFSENIQIIESPSLFSNYFFVSVRNSLIVQTSGPNVWNIYPIQQLFELTTLPDCGQCFSHHLSFRFLLSR